MGKRAKLKGALMAYAIGNALGKGTEFMEPYIIRRRYPDGLRLYSQIIQDAHRSMWSQGGWTNDTVLLMNMARGIVHDHGALLIRHQASILQDWFSSNSMDASVSMRYVLNKPDYVNNPLGTASLVWAKIPNLEPTNDPLGRAMLAALAPGDAETNSRTICELTHSDPRCEGMSAIIGYIARDLFNDGTLLTKNALLDLAHKYHPGLHPYIRVALGGSLENLELADEESVSDIRKTGSAAIWALYHCKDAAEALYRLIDAGGDTDTNASLALALIALRDNGEHNLPDHLIEELDGREELENLADSLADAWKLHDD